MEYEWIDDPGALDRMASRAAGAPTVALDCEAAGFHRYTDEVALLQLATRDGTWVVDPLAVDPSPVLRRLLTGADAAEMTAHGADFDLLLLERDLGIRPARLFDTQIAAALLGEEKLGLSDLLESTLDVRLPQSHQRADWARRPLPEGWVEYAAADTHHLLGLRDALEARLRERGRWEWATEEFDRLRRVRRDDDDDDGDPASAVKEARDLAPRELARLRGALRWRDAIARRRDRAPFRVAPKSALLRAARQRPETVRELVGMKGMNEGLAREEGPDLLAALDEADRIPEEEVPPLPEPERGPGRPTRDEQQRIRRLKDVRNRTAGELGIDRGVLMPNRVLGRIARENPEDRTALGAVEEVRGWQVELMGDPLLDALREG